MHSRSFVNFLEFEISGFEMQGTDRACPAGPVAVILLLLLQDLSKRSQVSLGDFFSIFENGSCNLLKFVRVPL